MKKIKSTIAYVVPHWQHCNNDNLTAFGELTGKVCRFCQKTKAGHRCMLYDQELATRGEFIDKLPECVRASAGFKSEIDSVPPPAPTIPPQVLMKEAIELYCKTMDTLLAQGYPRAIADKVARQQVYGEGK